MKIIDNVKVNSLKVSMSNIEKAVEIYINENPIQENKIFTCINGVCIDDVNEKLELSGNIIDSGNINITPSGTITYNKLIIDGYLCDKYNNEFICNKTSKNIEQIEDNLIIIENSPTSLNNYIIYGNSIQNGTPTIHAPVEIKNVGEKIDEQYTISVKIIGVNLLDKNTLIDGYITSNGTVENVNWYKCTDFIQVSGKYLIYSSCASTSATGRYYAFYDENKNFISGEIQKTDEEGNTSYILSIPTNAKYFRCNVSPSKSENAMVYLGKKILNYESYSPLITNIYLEEPLRKIGNYVDYIDYKNQKLIKNVGVLNLSSEDNFKLIDNYFELNIESYPKKDRELSISNYLEYENNFWFDENKLKIKIQGINTIEELKNWLNNNKVEIYYPLSKSIVSDIKLPEIYLYKNYSNLTVDTYIKPSNMLVEYD